MPEDDFFFSRPRPLKPLYVISNFTQLSTKPHLEWTCRWQSRRTETHSPLCAEIFQQEPRGDNLSQQSLLSGEKFVFWVRRLVSLLPRWQQPSNCLRQN